MDQESGDKEVRGYYTELATDLNFKSRKTNKLDAKKPAYLWEIVTYRHAPSTTLKPIKRPKCLAPAERWMCYEEEKTIPFPVDVFKPKVQLQYLVEPFQIPRNVEIEWKMRQYQREEIVACLNKLNVKNKEILPVDILRREWLGNKFGLYKMIHWLPLEWFDDSDFSCRTPQDWLDHGLMDGVRHPIPGQAFLPVLDEDDITHDRINRLYQWTNVAMTDYDAKQDKYKLLTLDGHKRTYCLPTIYVVFRAEEPMQCARRIKAAVDLRNATENLIKYEFFLDCMLLKGTYPIEPSWMERIEYLLFHGKPPKMNLLETLDNLKEEIQLNHMRALGELQFRYSITMKPDMYKFIKLPPRQITEVVKSKGKVDTCMEKFEAKKEFFRWYNLFVLPQTLEALKQIVAECIKVSQMLLFTSNYGKLVTLEEFEAVQNKFTLNVMKYLKYTWIDSTSFNLKMCIGDIGKGWFDINFKNYEIYDISKLTRLLECVRFRMQYALRVLVENSVTFYTNLIETPCQPSLRCDEDYVWGSDLINSPFTPKTTAIFLLVLKMSETSVTYSTDLDTFERILLKIYDAAIAGTHWIRQVQPSLLMDLKFPADLCLSSVGLLDEYVCQCRERFLAGYRKAVIPLKAYALEYHIHLDLFNLNVNNYLLGYKDEQHTAGEVKDEVNYHLRQRDILDDTLPSGIVIGPFFVNTDNVKQFLIQKRLDIVKKLLDQFAERMKQAFLEAIDEYKYLLVRLTEKPMSIEQIFDIKDWMETIPLSIKSLEENVKRMVLEYEILDYFWYNLPQEDFENKWEAIGWPLKLLKQIDETNDFLLEETERFLKIQLFDESQLQEKIEAFTVQVTNMYLLCDASKCHEIAIEMKRVWKAMKEAQEQGQLLNSRQKLFQIPVVPFDALTKLMKEFEPYKNLWATASDWLKWYDIWMDNPLLNIDGESIERTVVDMYKTMLKSIRIFADYPGIQNVAMDIKDQIDEFKPLIPLIQALRNPGMRPRHWDEFYEITGISLPFSAHLTFKECLHLGIAQHLETMTKISELSTKEYAIELSLDKMVAEWENNYLELTPYKKTGTFIMKVSDDIQQMLDDHIVLTQQLSFSPFKAALSDRIDEWEFMLRTASEVIEEWMDVQKQWMYLEPIFTSDDISKQLPHEAKKYMAMERTWKRIMRAAYDNPKIIQFCPDKKLLESLKDANHILEMVQKGLAEYLEMKRTIFPRLFFLSDDELLEILSQARNPLAVQPHLRKCFENIARLQFESDLQITKMFSAEEECVDLNPTLYPTGNVECWLLVVEDSMRNTVRTTFGKSLEDMANKDRKQWVLDWPGQIVIACCQTYWTAGVENGLMRNKLAEFFDVMLVNLDALRSLVKGSLTFLQRDVLSALIVIEVHARDVTQTLVDNNVQNVNDFDWISQLRYYWINEEVKVRAVNAEFQYGYEYLGNSGRLVITPLTDRCYLTLTGALHLKFGGAPSGPAGTGKTETTKDLGKAMAIQCVVFNCSDQLDFMAMGKFFKGLASSGAWACFDEFNRIDIEVLSVVAQQIMTIQKAQQARQDRLLFEGCDIVLKESCAVFITMNPGYAGRTELPDNLKALFRPVAMMVPNYTLIAEISLFSFGFSNAKQLANKITTTFKLSSEQLSSQDHYDFGMRAVKTVIAVAGNLKREKQDMDERQIVLRALRDVNVPKFLKDDLKLFNGIVSDLFPRMVEEAVDYGALEKSIRACCLKLGLEDVDEYVKKVIQLYETTVVRHGLMLVGPTGSGKTKCYEVLKDAMTALKGKPQPSGYPFQPAHAYVLNPKSITMGQLYGEFDLQTHEWTDGILPSLVRIGVAAEDKDKRWYVFDGPVDAVWIENMNTVLDDNKKLCLSSGEIIKLRDTQTMMFEVADLAVASPATVSRCGMVYLEPGVLGLQPFLNCWIKRLPDLAVEFGPLFLDLFNTYLYPALELLRGHLREVLTSVDSALVTSFLHMLDFRLGPLAGRDNKPPPPPQFLALLPDLIVPWVIFSLIWSIGCTCDNDGRIAFSEFVNSKMKTLKHKPYFPNVGSVYDYKLHDGGFTDHTEDGEPAAPTWHHWMENVEDIKITVDMKYSDIEVPTIDNKRNADLIGIILLNEQNVLAVGPTGTGKTLTMIGKLSRNMHKKFICDFINFSARTSANQTQDLIDSKLDRRRKGVFGPPVLKRQVFFIDDFNMPALEVYGAQPPIELIRQWMDFKGWYDRKSIGEFRTIIDVNFAAAMGPPGGGRNPITPRLLRHFHYLTFLEMEDNCKIEIFGKILKFWLERTPNMMKYFTVLLDATLNVYSTILKELLPTPAKTHYTFNLRDLSKVFQGVLMLDPETITTVEEIIRLWYHENCRVFQDRLVNDDDRKWFDTLLKGKITKDFKMKIENCLTSDTLLYGDFMDPASDLRPYIFINDTEKLSKVLNHYMDEYNNQSTRPMKLVLFLDAMSHICRISRIIRQPMGNALLLGMGGSGRQSLTRLSAHISEFFCFQIELTKAYGMYDWKEDVKQLMLQAGLMQRETVFLFSDTQIKSETFLEDLNNMLNSGDVPNVYQPDELDKIYQGMKGAVTEMGLAATKSNLFSVYQRQVRSNLHTVISMSPIGEIFRARLRQFPALVNCCTIDWFSAWPDTALQSVALQYLDDIPELDVSHDVLLGIVVMCQHMHASVVKASEQFLQELSRHNYVTPTSYLQLLSSYTDLMNKKKGALTEGVGRLKTGLDKLKSTAEEVKILQKRLEVMKPALEVAAAEADVMIKQIAADTVIAEETRVIVEKEEEVAMKKKIATQTIAEDAERDLAAALPALEAAEKSLQALNKNDITEVKAMKKPPTGVIYVIEAICIVKGVKPMKIPGKMPGEKLNDYWEPGRQMLADPGVFLQSLLNFDKDSITEEMIQKLKHYVNDPLFLPEKIIKVSKACNSLCIWVHAMYKFYFVNLVVAPKKAALAQAKADLAITEAAVAAAKAKMKEVLDGVALLNEKLAARIAFKEEKEQSINLCEERMNRAHRLISGLSDERIRWIKTIENIEASTVNVTGNILICSGAVAYLTPFTDKYRIRLFEDWMEVIKTSGVPHSEKCDPVTILGDPVLIRSWQIDGLPRDFLSTENAVLVSCSRRWPLFIDPQGQANKWIKNMGKARQIAICKLADKDLIRTLELAIRFGKPVLIENVGTELDPALDPVLLRSVYKQGNTFMLKLGDAIVPYNDDFQLYITTKLPNPHYTPEVSIKVQLVNFTLVPTGLQDQLLALVVLQERPDLEEQRSQIVISSAQMKQELKEIEDRILYKLSTSEGSPLDDIEFIITLESSKIKSEEIKSGLEAAEITQIDIDNTRMEYIPVANRGQILFFCLADLSNVDPMYQYSLEWFISIFVGSMSDTEKTDDLAERVETINEYFTFSLYSNVCRSLFEKDKLLFAFLLCVRIMMDENKISAEEWHHFLAGGSPALEMENPASDWLSDKAWKEILALAALPTFQSFVNTFSKYKEDYRLIFESQDPHRESLPYEIQSKLDQFQKLVILKSLRPDKVTNGMQDFLSEHMGQRFIEPQASDLAAMYKESTPTVPLIFVLSTGTDPAADLYKFADRMKMSKRLQSISLGQGQGPRAEKMISECIEIGSWVFFQNCHLAPSWMPRLERVVEQISPEQAHREFRIWLTSTPSPFFPVSILQNGSKMTVEPPRGLKANMLRAYSNQVADMSDFFHSEHPKVFNFKWLIFSLCMFHGCLLERRKFGPLGFNIPYEFTDGDLKICISQLYMFMMEYADVPFKVLLYTGGHINYGGRVTDDWDRRYLMNSLQDYYRKEVMDSNYKFDRNGIYHQVPGDTTLADYLDYIKTFPLNDNPALFGLHNNADISCAQAITYQNLSTLLTLQPKQVGGSSASQEDITAKVATTLLKQIPDVFDVEYILELYPVMYTESLNTVIVQEAIRYNKLLKTITSSLKDLLKALKGLVVMSEALEKMSTSLFSNIVPAMWASKAYPSLKPLGAWVDDLNARVKFLNKWVEEGIPPAFWISGFYFPQAFLTGTLQNFARKYIVSIDIINFSFRVLSQIPTERFEDGCAIYGLYLEGCRWNRATKLLDESFPKELYTEMPAIWMVPEENHKKAESGIYECPVYKTLKRAGTLSTTGHSTNYVIAVEVPSVQSESHWIKRGVALICALDY